MADRSRRARKPTPRDDSPPSAGSKGKAARTGKANKKRDDRSALVETWMVKNADSDKPTADVKTKYAEVSHPGNMVSVWYVVCARG